MNNEEKRMKKIINNLSVNEALQKSIDEDNLKKLYMQRIYESFYKNGYRSTEATLEEVYVSLNPLAQKYVNEGFDEGRIFLSIRRGFEQREKDKSRGKSR